MICADVLHSASHVPYLVQVHLMVLCMRRSKANVQGHTGVCIHVHLNAFVLACLFPAVVICIGSVIILFTELVSVASQYVLEAGHAL